MTKAQKQAIERRAVNNVSRGMMRRGVTMTIAQADAIGDEGHDWIVQRLDLRRVDAGNDDGLVVYARRAAV